MPASQSVFVVDSNILIDFHCGDLLTQLSHLPYAFTAPDLIVEELLEPDGPSLLPLGLRSEELPGALVLEVTTLRAKYGAAVSVNDLSALVLARHHGCTLLTGERNLRIVADHEGVYVHGTLWLLDQLMQLTIILAGEAVDGLQKMLARGRRLPLAECHERIVRWKSIEAN